MMELKGAIGHGNWEAWVGDHCGIKPRTAREYMKLVERWDEVLRLIDPDRRPAADLIRLSRKWILKQLANSSLGIDGTASGPDSIGTGDEARGPRDEQVGAEADGRKGHKPAKAQKADMSQGAATRHGSSRPDDGRRLEEGPGPDGRLASSSRRVGDGPAESPDGSAHDRGPASTSDEEAEGHGDDTAWLESLVPWLQLERLGNAAIFREEALLWRRIRPAIEHLHRIHRPSSDDMKAAGIISWIRQRYAYRVAALTGVKNPGEWRLCARCNGEGRSKSLAMPCDWCKGAGYQVAHQSDRAVGDQGSIPEGD
ncbi:hypothetical protein [Paludisphaera soli]|uniref:hypothetical protein n=1 Tax=Paludisphaera soli TaxID=2712865 RepID=UPI0013E9F88E|nr:hypothetical protein [Paludisphaera soli]